MVNNNFTHKVVSPQKYTNVAIISPRTAAFSWFANDEFD